MTFPSKSFSWADRALAETTLADDTLFGAALWGYVVWSVGGWRWALPPLIQLLSYATVTTKVPQNHVPKFRFPVVLAQIAGSVFWLLLYRESENQSAFYPFVSCYAANVAIIALVRHKFAEPTLRWYRALWINALKGMIVAIPSILLVDGLTIQAAAYVAISFLAVLTAAALFYRLQPGLSLFPVDFPRWTRQAIIVGEASIIAFLPFLSFKLAGF